MSNNNKENVIELPVNSITISNWDARQLKENETSFDALKISIQNDGLLHPVTVTNDGNNKYTLIAGRRRFRACKALGHSLILAKIKDIDEIGKKRIALIENIQRQDLSDHERCYGILYLYKQAGFTQDQAISGVKSIRNWFLRHPDNTWEDLIQSKTPIKHFKTSVLVYDKKFIGTCRSIGYHPNFQYQLLQLTRDIPESLLKKADELGMSTSKKIALTHSNLREHPKLQKEIIDEYIARESADSVREKVYQKVSDLQSGAIYKVGNNYFRRDSLRDDIKNNQTELKPSQISLRVGIFSKKLIFALTHKQIPRSRIRYDEITLNQNDVREFMIDVVQHTNDHELDGMEENLEICKKMIDKMLSLIKREDVLRTQKQEMMKK